jgi:hypothetical protein
VQAVPDFDILIPMLPSSSVVAGRASTIDPPLRHVQVLLVGRDPRIWVGESFFSIYAGEDEKGVLALREEKNPIRVVYIP